MQVDILAVLPVICHRSGLSDYKTACRMLVVSKDWRTILLQCQPWVVVDIGITGASAVGNLTTGFASWLEVYGRILSKLTLSTYTTERYLLNAADHIVGSSIQLAGFAGKPVGLQCLSMDYLEAPRLLRSLPAATLTSLTVQKLIPTYPSISYLAPSIQHLTNLRSCDLEFKIRSSRAAGVAIPPSCFSSLSMLIRLSSLQLSAEGNSLGRLQRLPPQLQQLTILEAGQLSVDASALTMLTALDLAADGGISTETRLPTSLSSLNLTGTPLQPGLLPVLSSVRKLSLESASQHSSVGLAELHHLPHLQSIKMSFTGSPAAAAAAAWKQLPQLQELHIDLMDEEGNDHTNSDAGIDSMDQRSSVILPGLAAATQLTRLSLSTDDDDLPCCNYVAQLSNLQELELSGVCGLRKDVLTLRALTKLTMLCLMDSSLDDAAAGGLICSLRNLRLLKLIECPNLSDAILPAMAAQLRGLRELCLRDLGEWSESSVDLLVELTQLSSLTVNSIRLTAPGVIRLKRSASFTVYTYSIP